MDDSNEMFIYIQSTEVELKTLDSDYFPVIVKGYITGRLSVPSGAFEGTLKSAKIVKDALYNKHKIKEAINLLKSIIKDDK